MKIKNKDCRTVMELVKEIYHEWGWEKDENFINNVKEKNAEDFAIQFHTNLGSTIRNEYGLWEQDSNLYNHFISIGINHPDDMSNHIFMELHKYANQNLNEHYKKYL